MSTQDVALRPSGAVTTNTRDEFGSREIQTRHETAATAVAAREQAAVQARYIVAERRPRNIEQFRRSLMDACERPMFAAKAEYAKPIGGNNKARGATIRFIETALQMYGNIYPEVATVFESPEARICRVSVTDLETNITYTTEVVINKTVERKGKEDRNGWHPPEGRTVISERINSYGEPTYLVAATEDEVLVKQNALLSKALRTNAQRLLPYDIVEECMALARKTAASADSQGPDAAKRRIIDSFAEIGIQPIDLEQYLGKSLNKPLVPAELSDLRGCYTAIKEGESTWEDCLAEKNGGGSEELAEETRARLIADAEAKKAAQQQQNSETLSGSGETNVGLSETKPANAEKIAAHGETKPAAAKPTFGRRGNS